MHNPQDAFTQKHSPGPKTHKHAVHTQKTQQSGNQDAQAQTTVEKGERDSNDQKSALGPRKANAMTASSVT